MKSLLTKVMGKLTRSNEGEKMTNTPEIMDAYLDQAILREVMEEYDTHIVIADAPVIDVGIPDYSEGLTSERYERTITMSSIRVCGANTSDSLKDVCRKAINLIIERDILLGIGTLFIMNIRLNSVGEYVVRFATTREWYHAPEDHNDVLNEHIKHAIDRMEREMEELRMKNAHLLSEMNGRFVHELIDFGKGNSLKIIPCGETIVDSHGVERNMIHSNIFYDSDDVEGAFLEAIRKILQYRIAYSKVYIHKIIKSMNDEGMYVICMYGE